MDLVTELKQFTGTGHWYRHPLTMMLFTDGVKHFADAAGAYWFVDLIAFNVLPLTEINGFASITLQVGDQSKAVVVATDGNDTNLWSEELDYTDCPAGVYEFFLTDGVLLLRTEY